MDNFEWTAGFSIRFGLNYVDYKDGKYTRYPKNSALWFMNFLKAPTKIPLVKELPVTRQRGVKRTAESENMKSRNGIKK